MKLKYVGPIDEIEVAGQTVLRNHQFEVSDELAGRAPDPRVDEIMAALNVTPRLPHEEEVALKDEHAALDKGSGLLAQPENFKPVAAARKEVDK